MATCPTCNGSGTVTESKKEKIEKITGFYNPDSQVDPGFNMPSTQPTPQQFAEYIGQFITGNTSGIPQGVLSAIRMMQKNKGSQLTSSDQIKIVNGTIQMPKILPIDRISGPYIPTPDIGQLPIDQIKQPQPVLQPKTPLPQPGQPIPFPQPKPALPSQPIKTYPGGPSPRPNYPIITKPQLPSQPNPVKDIGGSIGTPNDGSQLGYFTAAPSSAKSDYITSPVNTPNKYKVVNGKITRI